VSDKPKLMITVDVEAFPKRAADRHLDRLIWGRFTEGEGGILAMMRIAERHGVRLTMFTDLAETGLYGDAMIEVAQEIDRRGHDLELHCHPEFIPPGVWERAGVRQLRLLDTATELQARLTVDYLCEVYARATSRPPVAFRGGSYRFNAALLRALRGAGVVIDSSYNPSKPKQSRVTELRGAFRWSNGMLELPISCLEGFRGATVLTDFNFNAGGLLTAERLVEFLGLFHERYPDEVAVLVMHSWSFSKPQNSHSAYYDRYNEADVARFDQFLGHVGSSTQVVTPLRLHELQVGSNFPVYGVSEMNND
jgi:hypothetical protein